MEKAKWKTLPALSTGLPQTRPRVGLQPSRVWAPGSSVAQPSSWGSDCDQGRSSEAVYQALHSAGSGSDLHGGASPHPLGDPALGLVT